LGYRSEDAHRITAAAVGRLSQNKELTLLDNNGDKIAVGGRFLSEDTVRRFLQESQLIINRLGADSCAQLTDKCGILNFTNYMEMGLRELYDQLQWLNGEPIVTARYSDPNNPAMVYVQDGIGDWNGAFANTDLRMHHQALGPDGRRREVPRLFFEVNGDNAAMVRAEIVNYTQALNERGVIFSKLLIGGHGGDSGHAISFGGARLSSRRYDSENVQRDSEAERIAAYEEQNMLTWEDDAMRDLIRAVSADVNGERTIILKSCSQGKKEGGVIEEIARQRLDDEGVTRVFGFTTSTNSGLDSNNSRLYTFNKRELASAETTNDGRIVRKEYESVADLNRNTRDAMIVYWQSVAGREKGALRREAKHRLRDLRRDPRLVRGGPQGVLVKLKEKIFDIRKGTK
jgi:hypothetical protein